jgi:hypothetical protein
VFMLLYLIFSFAGNIFDTFFFAFHLMELFFTIRLLQLAFNAVALHGKSLCATLLMGMVLTYVYAAVGWRLVLPDFKYGFADLPEWESGDADADAGTESETSGNCAAETAGDVEDVGDTAAVTAGESAADAASNAVADAVADTLSAPTATFLDWVLLHWEIGMGEGPGSAEDWASGSRPLSYVILSLSYFIFIVVILGAVISGIIIDAFGEMRDDKAEQEEDMENVDFVSGIHRKEFDQCGMEFEGYRTSYHNPVHYMYYKLYLRLKDKTEYNGQESYIDDMLSANDPSFLPAGRSGALEVAKGKAAEAEQATPDWGTELTHTVSLPVI